MLFFFLFFFFQCKIEFYFTEWTPKAVFSRVAVATSENTGFCVHASNKIRSYTGKIKFSVSFMLLFAIIELLPTFRLSRQKTNFFFFPFRFNLKGIVFLHRQSILTMHMNDSRTADELPTKNI